MRGIFKLVHLLRAKFFGDGPPLVAVVRLNGVIGQADRFNKGLNIEGVGPTLEQAFGLTGLSAVAIVINSPGGSPVQSAFIADRIRDLAREKDVPVLAFAEDVAASGGYMLALAGDAIYAHEASIIGSIGVISGGFGFVKAMEKLGVERRIYTAGEKKSQLDPFSPENSDDISRIKDIQVEIHEFFKKFVRDRRGKRLKGARAKIFSGDFFTGTEAKKLGLIDEIGEMRSVLKERFGKKVRFKTVGDKKRGLLSMLGLGASTKAVGPFDAGELGHGLISAAEERLFWNRFGL